MDPKILAQAAMEELWGWAVDEDLPHEVVEKLEKRLRLEMWAAEPLPVELAETIRAELAIVSSFLREYRKITEAFLPDDPRLMRAQEWAVIEAKQDGIPDPDIAPLQLAVRVLEHLLLKGRNR